MSELPRPGLRRRFWIEAVTAMASALLALVTAAWPDWIERVFGIEPDHASGALERLILAVVVAVSVAFFLGARLEWRRALRAEAAK